MGNKQFVPDAEIAARLLRERCGDALADEFERLIAEGRRIDAVLWLNAYGIHLGDNPDP